jgi:hypothetical protein
MVRRGAAYAAGAAAGTIPMFAFNLWAFGDPLELAYGAAIESPGLNGHEVIGLNGDGFFGISAPQVDSAIDLLLAGRGLLVLTPILVMAVVGTLMLRRGTRRTEANVILAIAAVYFVYNSGYWLPFGGGTPGPRFLIPALPFLALGLATAYRRLPALTLSLAIPSAMFMVIGSLTYPLIGRQGSDLGGPARRWRPRAHRADRLRSHQRVARDRPVRRRGRDRDRAAVRATPSTSLSDFRFAFPAVLTWGWVSAIGPAIAADDISTLDRGNVSALWLVAAGVVLSLGTLTALRMRERRAQSRPDRTPAAEPSLGPELAFDEPTS